MEYVKKIFSAGEPGFDKPRSESRRHLWRR
jgi:hypothetical protein